MNPDPFLALLALKNTPIMGLDFSPAQLLMGRVLRSSLPSSNEMFKLAILKSAQSLLQCHKRKQGCFKEFRGPKTNSLEVLCPFSNILITLYFCVMKITEFECSNSPRCYIFHT